MPLLYSSFSKYSLVMNFIRATLSTNRKFFFAVTGTSFTFLTILDAYLYVSLGFSLFASLIVALSRFFLYLPLSVLFSIYLTVLRESVGAVSRKTGTAGVFGGISAMFFTILGCPPCLLGLLAILSSIGLLSGGLLFYMLYLQPYAGIFFILSVVVMLAGTYLIASSRCSVEGGIRGGKD